MADLYGGCRPMLGVYNLDGQAIGAGSITLMYLGNVVTINTWNVPVIASGAQGQPYYDIPFAGWWLVQGNVQHFTAETTNPQNYRYAMGFNTVTNGGTQSVDGESLPGEGNGGAWPCPHGADLYQFNLNSSTGDTVAWYGFTDNTSIIQTSSATMWAEWVALPTSGLTDYTGPYGAVVSDPAAAALWPPGPGGTLMAAAAAGAGTIVVSSVTGLVAGSTVSPDFYAGRYYQPVAESGTISSLPGGGTIVLSGTLSFPHTAGAPVAMPVSAAFLNQQVRDVCNFLAYPPILRAQSTATQTIPSSSNLPLTPAAAGTASMADLSASAFGCVDNFAGFSHSAYVIPVSGTYYVYGQVYLAGSSSVFQASAGVSVNGGTISWGTVLRSATSGAEPMCASYTETLRLTAGGTLSLWAYQSTSGSASMSTVSSGRAFSRLIAVWRSF